MRRLFGQRRRAAVGAAVFLLIASMAAAAQSATNQAGATAQSSPPQSSSTQPSPAPPSSQSAATPSTANQSLGDIARANRAKKESTETAPTPAKVITNADLPKSSDEYSQPPANSEAAAGSNQKSGRFAGNAGARKAAAAQRPVDPRAAAMWRGRILAQKAIIANLQGQVEELRSGMDYLNPGRGDPGANGSAVAFSPSEARRAARLRTMEQRLEQLKQRLDETEDAAREAGMGSKVFDP